MRVYQFRHIRAFRFLSGVPGPFRYLTTLYLMGDAGRLDRADLLELDRRSDTVERPLAVPEQVGTM